MVKLAALLMALLWPTVLGFAYLNLTPEYPPLLIEYAALVITLVPGAMALWWLCPFNWLGKSAFTILYVLVMGTVLFLMAFQIICGRFGECFF